MVKKGNRRFTRCNQSTNVGAALQQWYATPLGQRMAETERQLLNSQLSNLFGYYLLLIGNNEQTTWLSSSRVSRRMTMDITNEIDEHNRSRFYGKSEAMPVTSDSLDVIVLPHILEFSDNPHRVLREVDRCLVPEGHVVIMGFNPFSFWSLWRLLLGWRGRLPWCGHFISPNRARDWMKLLSFEVVDCEHYFFRPPVQHEKFLQRLNFMERIGKRLWPILGGGYVMVARKQVAAMTPIRPRWRPARKLAPGLVEPMSQRNKYSTRQSD
ncbi:class I SAM-dependent methyltransferase [Kaarinaea lacus]